VKAWAVKRYELDAPSSTDTAKYDIAAKIPPSTTPEQFRLMLQRLLTERLRLTVHMQPTPGKVYDLSIAKSGVKLRPIPPEKVTVDPESARRLGAMNIEPQPDAPLHPAPGHAVSGVGSDGTRRISGRQQSMAQIIALFEVRLHTRVIDNTSLTGIYDWDLEYDAGTAPSPDSAPQSALDPIPGYIRGVERSLGLKLQSKTGEIDVLHVDGFTPVPNN
jgi:uncharacterized protein (TIGR03435 family)